MSLLDEFSFKCKRLVSTASSDGLGGQTTTYAEADSFVCAIVRANSQEVKVAEAMGEKASFTITTKKNIVLKYHDIVKRDIDGKVFRVTSDGSKFYTPSSSNLNLRQVTAEEWRLP